ncbi:2Fe-2S iron-sulfur cluster-binding protein [Cryobacterium roopkundense]|uniref:Ferredoxin-NADP reductase n=1 Tax=Cryobacterium roopkundense TaxID=1001240 RepID=A0A7W9E583_9MICO|nr:2Fe-2S iron-sulfur cluster-binding protein [Cryobacterium roopkundense]MBB5643492.1 ferredoxin-NADP reductase [Cryobacterium roopkundense]
MTEPHLWWYISRASAIIAWALMTASVVWGILLSTRVMRRVDNPAWLQDLHRFLGGTMLIMVGLHMVSLMLDKWLAFTPGEVLAPFATDFKPLPVALGILAFYLLLAIQGSSLLMNRLPRKFWKGVHYSSFAALILISFHAGFTGTDVGSLWYKIVAVSLIAVVAVAIIIRISTGTATRPARKIDAKRAAPGGASPVPQPEKRGLVVASATPIAEGVLGIRLERHDWAPLPLWHPGAHLTLHLPNGLDRQYSLCGDPADRHHYDIAVLRTVDSEGGSEWIHQHLVPGMTIEVSGPLNHFELEPAPEYLFIAGGIGITPMKAMIESLPAQRDWRLVYVGRSRRTMAFAAELEKQYPGRVLIQASDENTPSLNLDDVIGLGADEVYCCGPESLMSAVAARVPAERMHLERFVALERAGRPAAPVHVECRKSRKACDVPAGQSILEALVENGLPVLASCRKGVCGTCEVRVLAGDPEHLDSVMDDDDKESLRIMYPASPGPRHPPWC